MVSERSADGPRATSAHIPSPPHELNCTFIILAKLRDNAKRLSRVSLRLTWKGYLSAMWQNVRHYVYKVRHY